MPEQATYLLGAAVAEAGLPDGEYVPDGFTFSGGSGKVTIACPRLTVTDGERTVTVEGALPEPARKTALTPEMAAKSLL